MKNENTQFDYDSIADDLLLLVETIVPAHASCFFPIVGSIKANNHSIALSYQNLYSTSFLEHDMIKAYESYYYQLDPFHPNHLESNKKSVFTLDQLMSHRHESYKQFLLKYGYAHETNIFIRSKHSIIAGIALFRKADQGPFNEVEILKLETALPFISRSMAMLVKQEKKSVLSPAQKFYLTKKQVEICYMVAEGKTNKQIAADLNSSPLTIKTHIHNIFEKTNVSNRAELIATLFNNNGGWIAARQ